MSKALLLNAAASGAAGGGVTYVDDVFSTYLYDGTGSSQTIINGIDLSGEGGLVWIKRRSSVRSHGLFDTERGVNKRLYSHLTLASGTNSSSLTAFNSNGFTVGTESDINGSSTTNVAWTFRKAEKFFDIVTWTGSGAANHTISHNLGSTPGMIIWKKTSNADSWGVWHRSFTGYILLEGTAGNSTVVIDNVSDTSFRLKYDYGFLNSSSETYIAYIFGHNEAAFGEYSDEAIIHCGTYTGSGSTGKFVDLGFEPQWVLVKNTDTSAPWVLIDTMRGMPVDGDGVRLLADQNVAEVSSASYLAARATGMEVTQQNTYVNTSGQDYIYMAIARPHKPASEFTATQVFQQQAKEPGEGADTFISTGFPVDALIYAKTDGNIHKIFGSRLTGGQKCGGELLTDSNSAEGTNSGGFFLDHSTGVTVDHAGGHFQLGPSATDNDYIRYFFRRVPGFFDVVTYTSNTTYPNTFAHNLGVVPELVIVKRRDGAANWTIYAAPSGNAKHFYLNSTAAEAASSFWNSTTPTASVVHVGGQDEVWGYGGYDYIALLFASASGISKIGSYSGTGSSQNIDCGFSSGPRFVLIKNKNNAGGWLVWDSARGITANNDPYLRIDSNDGNQNYTGDDIDPISSGFNVSSNNNSVNKSGRDYIFLAIA